MFRFLSILTILIVYGTELVFCDKIYPDDAFKIVFNRKNLTYGASEYVPITVIHNRKTGDPDLEEVRVHTTSLLKTFRRSCDDVKTCEIVDSTYVKLATGNLYFFPFPDPVKIGINKIEIKDADYIRSAYPPSFEGINGYTRHGISVMIKTKDNRTQEFPISYYNNINGIDLSKNSTYEKPLVCEQRTKIHGKDVYAKVELPKNGWVYPETIPVKVTIENKSSWIIKQIPSEVVMTQKTLTRLNKKNFELEDSATGRFFKPSEKIVAVANAKFSNSEKKSFTKKETISFPIHHKDTSFVHSIKEEYYPISVSHSVKVSVQLTNPSNSSDDVDLPVSLDCEFPVTFGVVPTKSTKVKSATKWVPSDKSYQATFDIDNTVSYPSFEQLRSK